MIGIDIEHYPSQETAELIASYFFNDEERSRFLSSQNKLATFTGIYCAKEAIFKSIKTKLPEAKFFLKEFGLEYDHDIPKVIFSDNLRKRGISQICVSISHSKSYAVAICVIC